MVEQRIDTLALVLTYQCNNACHYCYIGREFKHRSLPLPSVMKVLDEVRPFGQVPVVLVGGEVGFYKGIGDVIDRIMSMGSQVWIYTNGSFTDERLLKELATYGNAGFSLSINSHIREINDETRTEGSFQKTLDLIRLVRSLNPSLPLHVNTIVSQHNIAGLLETADFVFHTLHMNNMVIQRVTRIGNARLNGYDYRGITGEFLKKSAEIEERFPGKVLVPKHYSDGCPIYRPGTFYIVCMPDEAEGFYAWCAQIYNDKLFQLGSLKEGLVDILKSGRIKRLRGIVRKHLFRNYEEIYRKTGMFTCEDCYDNYHELQGELSKTYSDLIPA